MNSEYDDSGETYNDYLERGEQYRATEDAEWLRSKGYLVLAPSDTSTVAELVRAAVERGYCDLRVIGAVQDDPAVKAWVESGRK